jgi:hypothetical protein
MKIRKFNENQKDNNLYDALSNIINILNIDNDLVQIKHPEDDVEYLISELDEIKDIEEWDCIEVVFNDNCPLLIELNKGDSNDVFGKTLKFFQNLIRINNTLPDGWKLSSEFEISILSNKICIFLIKKDSQFY